MTHVADVDSLALLSPRRCIVGERVGWRIRSRDLVEVRRWAAAAVTTSEATAPTAVATPKPTATSKATTTSEAPTASSSKAASAAHVTATRGASEAVLSNL